MISSYDWGGYGYLKVTAELHDDKGELVGHLKGEPQTLIPIPKRRVRSNIAEYARKALDPVEYTRLPMNAGDRLDDDDSEDDDEYPGKNRFTGDGLTLYEEYRGFLLKTKHEYGDPKKKDLFVCNQVAYANAGLTLFAKRTGLNVRELDRDEMSEGSGVANRVINFNRSGQNPWKVDQHGIVMRKVGDRDSPMGPSEVASTRMRGSPKNVRVIVFNPNPVLDPRLDQEARDRLFKWATMHELGHAVNLPHHGEGSPLSTGARPFKDLPDTQWIVTLQTDGKIMVTENGEVIEVRGEDDKPSKALDSWALKLSIEKQTTLKSPVWLGVPGGEHSGDDLCFMRYSEANSYKSKRDPKVRYYFNEEQQLGFYCCTEKNRESSVNSLSHRPQSRFGNASNGECRFHICVSDAYSPP